jgi:hypothetical protein
MVDSLREQLRAFRSAWQQRLKDAGQTHNAENARTADRILSFLCYPDDLMEIHSFSNTKSETKLFVLFDAKSDRAIVV